VILTDPHLTKYLTRKSVGMPSVCMCASLEPERLEILVFYSYAVFKSLSVTALCPANMSTAKTGSLHVDPPKQTRHFLENGCHDLDYISVIYGYYFYK
jgi:hypothetical protein